MIEKVTSIEEGVKKLLAIRRRPIPAFTLEPKRPGEYHDTLVWEGKRILLFDVYHDARIRRMGAFGADAAKNSALNVYSFTGSDVALDELIYREIAIAEYLLHSRVEKVTAFVCGGAVNLIAVMENGSCANMDLGNTMAPGSVNQCQHRLITTHGMTNDRAVGTMTTAHQLYVYGADSTAPDVYDDDEYYLYGLDDDEVAKVMTIHGVLTGAMDYADWEEKEARYRRIVAAVYASDKQGKTVPVGGGEA